MIAENYLSRTLYEPLQVARKLRVHPATVRRWLRSGKLRAVCYGGIIKVDGASIEEFIERSTEEFRARYGIDLPPRRTPRQRHDAADRAAEQLGVEIKPRM